MNQNFMMNMLLNQLKNRNPSGYNQVMNLMNSGRKPEDILNSMVNSGQISRDQINQASSYLNNMKDGPKTF